jgi:hypothetical protein
MKPNCENRKLTHLCILDGLDRIKIARKQLQALYDEIVGAVNEINAPSPKDTKERQPHFAKVLKQIEPTLNDEAAAISELVVNLRNELF